jgi:hypothetical protein
MSKPCIELHCPDYEKINADIIAYLSDRTQILQRDPRKDPSIDVPYPNFVDTKDFIQHNPKLLGYFSSLGMLLYHVYYAVAFEPSQTNSKNPFANYSNPNETSSCPIHLDRPPVQWKMNWPVMNMIGTGTRFYKLKDSDCDVMEYLVRSGIAGSLERDVWNLPYEPFEEMYRHVFGPAPILMNGLIPHDVWFSPDSAMPRIGLQMMFFKEPRHLLDNDCIVLSQD